MSTDKKNRRLISLLKKVAKKNHLKLIFMCLFPLLVTAENAIFRIPNLLPPLHSITWRVYAAPCVQTKLFDEKSEL